MSNARSVGLHCGRYEQCELWDAVRVWKNDRSELREQEVDSDSARRPATYFVLYPLQFLISSCELTYVPKTAADGTDSHELAPHSRTTCELSWNVLGMFVESSNDSARWGYKLVSLWMIQPFWGANIFKCDCYVYGGIRYSELSVAQSSKSPKPKVMKSVSSKEPFYTVGKPRMEHKSEEMNCSLVET